MSLPYKIHELLSADELKELESFARHPGKTVDMVHAWMTSRGKSMSRGAVWNWLKHFRAQPDSGESVSDEIFKMRQEIGMLREAVAEISRRLSGT